MYGRLVEVEGVDPSKRAEVLHEIRETVIPALKEIDGFAGFISLVDEENRRARSIVLWETQESADEAERQFKARREEMVRGMGATVRSADLYEAAIVEVTAGAHA
jgi:heme-degrading monooxygenase HmoA